MKQYRLGKLRLYVWSNWNGMVRHDYSRVEFFRGCNGVTFGVTWGKFDLLLYSP